MGLVDFSRLTHELAARLKKVVREHGISESIETLDAFRYGKINKRLTHSATEKSIGPETAVENYATLKETKAV